MFDYRDRAKKNTEGDRLLKILLADSRDVCSFMPSCMPYEVKDVPKRSQELPQSIPDAPRSPTECLQRVQEGHPRDAATAPLLGNIARGRRQKVADAPKKFQKRAQVRKQPRNYPMRFQNTVETWPGGGTQSFTIKQEQSLRTTPKIETLHCRRLALASAHGQKMNDRTPPL